jgi:hypothetical protein
MSVKIFSMVLWGLVAVVVYSHLAAAQERLLSDVGTCVGQIGSAYSVCALSQGSSPYDVWR